MKVSVLIPTHNRADLLRRCLTAVSQQTHPAHEIIVIEDASTDETAAMVTDEFPNVTLIRHEQNQGPAVARNHGIAAATGELIAMTDDDCLPPPDWLAQLVAAMRETPELGGVGGYQEAPDELIAANRAARADHFRRLKRWGERAFHKQIGRAEVPGLASNNVAYRRDLLQQLGGFDPTFPLAAGEDADLKKRMADCAPLCYLPLKVVHLRPYTLAYEWRTALRRGVGVYHFEAKHGSPPTVGRVLLRMGKRTAVFLRHLTQLHPDIAFIIYLAAIGDALGQLQTLFKQRANHG